MTADEMVTDPPKFAAEGAGPTAADKGKAKDVSDQPAGDAMDDDDDDTDEEGDGEEEAEEAAEGDGMEGLDASNIMSGGRTRGKVIDFAKAAAENPPDADEDEEDDEDFKDDDKMDED